MRTPLESTGWIVALDEEGEASYRGTCFAFGRANCFLTAAHCVEGLDVNQVSVGVYWGEVEEGLVAQRIERHPDADLAIVEIPDHGPQLETFSPFRGFTEEFDLGAPVTAFGYPEFATREVARPTPRFFRGHVQRVFAHERSPYSYMALELNFGAPAGLSGGPVALEKEPSKAVGIVTGNLEVSTLLTKEDVVEANGNRYSERVERIVEYAVAVSLRDVVDWLADMLPT